MRINENLIGQTRNASRCCTLPTISSTARPRGEKEMLYLTAVNLQHKKVTIRHHDPEQILFLSNSLSTPIANHRLLQSNVDQWFGSGRVTSAAFAFGMQEYDTMPLLAPSRRSTMSATHDIKKGFPHIGVAKRGAAFSARCCGEQPCDR